MVIVEIICTLYINITSLEIIISHDEIILIRNVITN